MLNVYIISTHSDKLEQNRFTVIAPSQLEAVQMVVDASGFSFQDLAIETAAPVTAPGVVDYHSYTLGV